MRARRVVTAAAVAMGGADADASAAVEAAMARDAERRAALPDEADDRLPMLEAQPALGRRAAGLAPLLALSLAVHLGLFASYALVNTPAPVPLQQETPVEVVQEPPAAPAPAKPAVQEAQSKPEPPEPPKPEPPKPEPQKPAVPAPETSKPEPAKPERAKPEPAKAPPPPATPDKAEEAAKKLQSLEQEFAALKAERAMLQAQAAAAAEAEASKALGPLPASFRAVAMPAESVTGDEVVSYEREVFSQLAKAKKAGKHIVSPGVAHVVFNIDAQGNLLTVTLDHASGDPFLDGEAVAIVRRAAPFPPPPEGARRTFSASVHFVVDE